MKLKNKKILITGGAGFIGSNLVDYFIQNNKVTVLDNLLTGKEENINHHYKDENFVFIKGDIRDLETCKKAVKDIDYVFHQAALGSVPRSINDPITTNEINISGFLNMLTASRDAKVKRFIYAASSSTYGDSKKLPKVEEEIGKPLSPYAVTKYVNELYANVFANLYKMKIIGLRYFNVFGKRQDPNGAYAAAIPLFIKLFIDGEQPTINGDGSATRDFTYIKNVVQINELAALTENTKALNQVYNVAFGENINLNTLIALLKENLAKYDSNIINAKVIYGPDRVGDIHDSLADISKAKTLLAYNPKYSVKQGLKEAIDWYWNYFSNYID
jgi:UDP-N-acetylglucosamine 4-epimerase